MEGLYDSTRDPKIGKKKKQIEIGHEGRKRNGPRHLARAFQTEQPKQSAMHAVSRSEFFEYVMGTFRIMAGCHSKDTDGVAIEDL